MNSKLFKLFGVSFALAVLAVPFGNYAKQVKGLPALTLNGSGTKEDPYLISEASDFKLFNEYVENDDANKFYKLANDISIEQTDLYEKNSVYSLFNIGSYSKPFTGTFDGDGHTITLKDISIDSTGFFDEPSGTIENIVFKGKVTTAGYGFGLITVTNEGTIKNCESYVEINSGSAQKTGAFTARNYGTIDKCYNYGDITSSGGEIGGITALICSDDEEGYIGKVINCINHGTIKHTGDKSTMLSGIVGYTFVMGDPIIVSNCVNFGDVIGEKDGDIVSGILNSPTDYIVSENIKCLVNYGKITSNGSTTGEGIYGCISTPYDSALEFDASQNFIYSVREDDHYAYKGDGGYVYNIKPGTMSGNITVLNDAATTNEWNTWYPNTLNLPTLHNDYYGIDQESTFRDTFYITDDIEIGTLIGTGCTLDFSAYDSFEDFELRLFTKEGRSLESLAGSKISSNETHKKVIAEGTESKTFLWKLSEFSPYEFISFEEVEHEFLDIEGKAATCKEDGYKSACICAGCGEYWSDSNQNEFIGSTVEDYNKWISSTGKGFIEHHHTLEEHKGNAATCYNDGLLDFYECTECGLYFKDKECKDLIGDEFAKDAWALGGGRTIPAHHNEEPVKTDEVEATCTEAGCKAYWYCPDCENYFSDEALTEANKIGDSAALTAWKADPSGGLIPATGHGGVKQDGKGATPSEDGYKEYYLCEGCGKYFEDEACTIEIQDLEAWKLNEGKIEKNGLTGGAIAGIVVGSTVVAAAGGFSIFWFPIKRRTWAELVEAIKKLGKTVVGKIKKE